MIDIEIDGKKLKAEQGDMIIEVADAHDIRIPRFCYHKKLSIAANCRMCLVDVENSRKPLPACQTPVADGMVIRTASALARDAQKAVMEFLLINHPLDCPICDQGGECELQDVAMGFGRDVSRFTEGKRVVADKNIGPLIATDMTRCIQCTRCVRFGREIAGIRELGAVGRGEHMKISTFIEQSVDSEVSGNIIDLCPVGALTDKPARFKARAWEMRQTDSVSPHDCIGANLHVHSVRGKVIRVVPQENEAVNEVWLADRDRFSHHGLSGSNRLLAPMLRQDGEWRETDWETGLAAAAEGLRKVVANHGGVELGALASASCTTEEYYLLQKLMRGLGTQNIDHRLRLGDFSQQSHEPLYPELGVDLADLELLESTLLIGADLRKEQPIAALRLRKATRSGRVVSIHDRQVYDNFDLTRDIRIDTGDYLPRLASLASALLDRIRDQDGPLDVRVPDGVDQLLKDYPADDEAASAAEIIATGERKAVIVGLGALEHSSAGHIKRMAGLIARLAGASYGQFSHGGNSAGAWLAGAIPHRGPAGAEVSSNGLDAKTMLTQQQQGLLLLNTEPGKDSAWPEAARQTLEAAEFVVSLTPFADDEAFDYADVILPVGGFTETSGTYVNVNGRWQTFRGAVAPPGQARPAWKVLRVLGNLLELKGFEYVSSEEVLANVQGRLDAEGEKVRPKWQCPEELPTGGRVPDPQNIYAVDHIVRRSAVLQATSDGQDRSAAKRPNLSPFHNIMGLP